MTTKSKSPQSSGKIASIKSGLHLKRPCLLVSDLERSLTLYRDTIGFHLDYVGAADDDSYLYTVFKIPPESCLTFAALSTAHEPRSLALTEIKGVPLPQPQYPHRIAIVIQVSDVTSSITTIQKLGLEVIQPQTFTAPPNMTFTEQGFYDFDGHLIVLYDKKISHDS